MSSTVWRSDRLPGFEPDISEVAGDVWVCTSAFVSELGEVWPTERILSTEEQARADRRITESGRRAIRQSLLVRRLMLARATGQNPAALRFGYGKYGRPELRPNPWGIRFNMSHSRSLIAGLVTTGNRCCGIDIESINPSPEVLLHAGRVFRPSERAELAGLDPAARSRRFVELWVLKEAYTKALGLGLRHRFDSFGFSFDEAGAITLADPAQSASEWDLRVAGPLCGHRLAVAVRRGADPLTPYRLVVDGGADGDRDLMPALAVAGPSQRFI
jgi:4'-phosphopantetheinyl transferase